MSHYLIPSALIRTAGVAVVAGVALLGAACSSSSSGGATTGGPRWTNETRNTFTATLDLESFRDLGFDLRWSGAAVMTRGARVARADVFGDGVVVQETGNAVSMLRTETGEAVWSTVLGRDLTRFVGNARGGDRVFVASDVELFVLSAETGDLVDRQALDLIVNTPPVVIDGAAFFGTPNGRVLAHDVHTGHARWQYQLSGSFTQAPVIAGGSVAAASTGGDVVVFDTSLGKATGRGRAFDGPGGSIDATEDVVVLASRDQSVYGFATEGSQRLWRLRTEAPLGSDVRIIDGVAYVGVPGGDLVGLDLYSGEEIWRAEGVNGTALGIAEGGVLVQSAETLMLVDDRGEVAASVRVKGLHSAIMPDRESGDLYLVTHNGAVSRFNRR